jgi:hypothetical protein
MGHSPLRNIWRIPKGQRLESHTKTLTERVFPRSQLHPLHIGRGLGKVDASFTSFLRAEEKENLPSSAYEEIGLITNRLIARVASTGITT